MLQPFATLLLSLLSITSICFAWEVPVIQTTSGKLRGIEVSDTINAYLGIPYAVPPVGSLRFRAAQPLDTPNVARNTTSIGPACVQLQPLMESPTGESEDCLHLNIWTSQKDVRSSNGSSKPVFVWLYGGGWIQGATSWSINDPTGFANTHPDIIFVSLNYRLNIFGFPSSPAITSQDKNAGLRDQFLAIEWIRQNIAAFGGDPNRLVLGGESAGAGSTNGYVYAHPTNSLISGAITMSGQAELMGAIAPYAPDSFELTASALGCPLSQDNYTAQLDCVNQKNMTEVVAAMNQQNITGVFPLIDNQTVFSLEEYKARGRAGNFAKVPVLTGTLDNEGDFFAYDPTTNMLNETESEYITLSQFRCFDSWQSTFTKDAGVPTYRYRNLGAFPALSPPPLRAWHGSDNLILFGQFMSLFPGSPQPTELEKAATAYMQKAWAAFIKDPANGLKALGWKTYEGEQGSTLVDLFRNNSVENPIQFDNPTQFDSGCAAIGLGL
ncbi:alpha/beta-hydrolase [Serendipita vermifera]|nr:alpha/beta-hydrolase [Serendipita vermifera]